MSIFKKNWWYKLKIFWISKKISKWYATGIFCIQRLIPPQAAHLRMQGADDEHQPRPELCPFSSCSSVYWNQCKRMSSSHPLLREELFWRSQLVPEIPAQPWAAVSRGLQKCHSSLGGFAHSGGCCTKILCSCREFLTAGRQLIPAAPILPVESLFPFCQGQD